MLIQKLAHSCERSECLAHASCQQPQAGKTRTIAAFIMLLALSLASLITSAWANDTEGEAKRVVILNSTDSYLPAFLLLDNAMRKTILAESNIPVELYAEALDLNRFLPSRIENELLALLRKKYQDLKVDVIVADGPIALDFARRHGEIIWPGATIVFNSVPIPLLQKHKPDPDIIGVPLQFDFVKTLDLALRLRPETQQVVVIAGTADPDQKRLSILKNSLERYRKKFDVRYLVGLSLADTITAVRAIPADAIILYVTVFRDGNGAPKVPRHVLTRLAKVSHAPIFGTFDTYLGNGIAAGSIVSFETMGKLTGKLVARVLNGEAPSSIGVQESPETRCIADWQQLQHWGLDENLLPPDCEVRFREITIWDRYHVHFTVALTVILVQSALIIVLMLNRRRLKQTQTAFQDEFDRRNHAETTASRLRGRLVRFSKERSLGTMATTLSHEINQPLIAIQNYAQAAMRRLQSDAYEKPKLLELFSKIEGQAQRAGDITQRVRSLVNSSEPHLTPIPLAPLVEEVVGMMEPECENRGCQIIFTPLGNLPDVLADALQVQLVMVNLMSNAIRSVCATEESSKQIFINKRQINASEVQVSVTDTGGGVPPDRVEDIFESMYSGTGTGMGMGLAICREIIVAHGGRIWYEPNPAGGSIFSFTLRTEQT
jgi:signal transduction histidine kinase